MVVSGAPRPHLQTCNCTAQAFDARAMTRRWPHAPLQQPCARSSHMLATRRLIPEQSGGNPHERPMSVRMSHSHWHQTPSPPSYSEADTRMGSGAVPPVDMSRLSGRDPPMAMSHLDPDTTTTAARSAAASLGGPGPDTPDHHHERSGFPCATPPIGECRDASSQWSDLTSELWSWHGDGGIRVTVVMETAGMCDAWLLVLVA